MTVIPRGHPGGLTARFCREKSRSSVLYAGNPNYFLTFLRLKFTFKGQYYLTMYEKERDA